MYQPPHHREDRLDVQHALIRAHPLGLIISAGADGPIANPVPFLLLGRAVQGARLEDGVLADVAPTLLELAELPRWDGVTGTSRLVRTG